MRMDPLSTVVKVAHTTIAQLDYIGAPCYWLDGPPKKATAHNVKLGQWYKLGPGHATDRMSPPITMQQWNALATLCYPPTRQQLK